MRNSRIILLVALIISLGVMGVGYAAWTDQITIGMKITAGHTDVKVIINEGRTWLGDGQYLDVDVNDKEVKITGKVYHGFDDILGFDIFDDGSVPVVFKEIEEGDNNDDVISLEKRIREVENDALNTKEVRESFNLRVKTKKYDDSKLTIMDRADEIESLEKQEKNLKNEIEKYKKIQKYESEYTLLFDQIGSGVWSEEVTIKVDIEAVAAPDVLDQANNELKGLVEDLKVLKGEELEEEEIVDEVEEEEIKEEKLQDEKLDSSVMQDPDADKAMEERVKGEEVSEDESESEEEFDE